MHNILRRIVFNAYFYFDLLNITQKYDHIDKTKCSGILYAMPLGWKSN